MIAVRLGSVLECCGTAMALQRSAEELTEPGLLFQARHVCLGCAMTIDLAALVPHGKISDLRGKRAPGGRAPLAAPPPELPSPAPPVTQ